MSLSEYRYEQAWAEAIARVWYQGDEEFRKKLLSDPKQAFAELGAIIPSGVNVRVVENRLDDVTFVIPPKPQELEQLADQSIADLYQACIGAICSICSSGTQD